MLAGCGWSTIGGRWRVKGRAVCRRPKKVGGGGRDQNSGSKGGGSLSYAETRLKPHLSSTLSVNTTAAYTARVISLLVWSCLSYGRTTPLTRRVLRTPRSEIGICVVVLGDSRASSALLTQPPAWRKSPSINHSRFCPRTSREIDLMGWLVCRFHNTVSCISPNTRQI